MSFRIGLMKKRLSRGVLLSLIAAAGTLAGLNLLPITPSAVVARALAADPTGEQVMDKFIEVTGGKAAYEKVKGRAISGKIEIMPQGLKGDLNTVTKSSKQSRTTINFTGLGLFESGINGDVAWEKNPITGVRILDGVEKDRALREADVSASADWKKYYSKVENKGVKEINGKPAYEVELTPKEGNPVTQYFSTDTGLLVQMDMKVTRPEGEFEIVATPDEWKDFGGIKVPTKTTQVIKNVGQEQHITIENIESNPEIPDSKFDLPDDVKAMVGPATKPSK